MESFRERFTYILQSGWDRQSLLLLGVLAFLLAIWLLYRILRYYPRTEGDSAAETRSEKTLITQVPPPPLPKIEKLLTRLEGDYPEFTEIVRSVLGHTASQTLLGQPDLRRSFAHLEVLLQRAEKTAPKGTLGIAAETKFTAAEMRRDAKATMLTIIRLLQEVEGVREKSGVELGPLVDRFLEKV